MTVEEAGDDGRVTLQPVPGERNLIGGCFCRFSVAQSGRRLGLLWRRARRVSRRRDGICGGSGFGGGRYVD